MVGRLVIDQYKNVYVAVRENGNLALLKLGSSEFNGRVVQLFRDCGQRLNRRQLAEFTEELRADAEASGLRADVWRRVAPHPDGGTVIALHDEQNTHVHIRPGQVEVLAKDSEIFFYRSPSSAAMVMPAATGDYTLLRQYLNLDAVIHAVDHFRLADFTSAHAKIRGHSFADSGFHGRRGHWQEPPAKVMIRPS